MTARLFHGGIPGLRAGGLIAPGHERQSHDGCPWCEARKAGTAHLGIDQPSALVDRVYCTEDRMYAKHYASLWGYGDLYRVEPVGACDRSAEDTITSYAAEQLRVVAVLDRAVLLTNSERRRLWKIWAEADQLVMRP